MCEFAFMMGNMFFSIQENAHHKIIHHAILEILTFLAYGILLKLLSS